MSDSSSNGALATWQPAECPIAIRYIPQVMDDIRLTVMDAFFSLPRGGAEIGGILLGVQSPGEVVITDYLSLECEHAFGPSFTLSPRDHSRLADLMATAQLQGQTIVGWYHSHTRSGICLNDADLEVHNRYFRDPGQIALVMKPSTFDPTRCGFFFREPDGSIHATTSYLEFELEAPAARPAPVQPEGPQPVDPQPPPPAPPQEEQAAPPASHPLPQLVTPEPPSPPAPPAPEPASEEPARELPAPEEPKPEEPPATYEAPQIAAAIGAGILKPEKRSLAWVYWLVVACAVVGIAYLTRDHWMGGPPPPAASARAVPASNRASAPASAPGSNPAPPTAATAPPANAPAAAPVPQPVEPPDNSPPSLALLVTEKDNHLQIQWDRTAVQAAHGGVLEIIDGTVRRNVKLSAQQLQSGSFSYGRQAESVQVQLKATLADDVPLEDMATFLGSLPERRVVDDPKLRRERDALSRENTRLKSELSAQTEHARKLQQVIDEMKRQAERAQQKRRLNNQSVDPQ